MDCVALSQSCVFPKISRPQSIETGIIIFFLIGTDSSRQGLVSLFNGISTFVGYLMPKPYT